MANVSQEQLAAMIAEARAYLAQLEQQAQQAGGAAVHETTAGTTTGPLFRRRILERPAAPR